MTVIDITTRKTLTVRDDDDSAAASQHNDTIKQNAVKLLEGLIEDVKSGTCYGFMVIAVDEVKEARSSRARHDIWGRSAELLTHNLTSDQLLVAMARMTQYIHEGRPNSTDLSQ